MNDRIFWVLAILIAAAIALDAAFNESQGFLFLARKTVDFVQVLAFWRH